MSEAELKVQQKHSVLYNSIKRTDPTDADWEDIAEDLEKLSWLVEENNVTELINAVWSITEKNAISALQGKARFRVLKLSRVKVFVTTVAHNITNLREDVRDICSLCRKHILEFGYFQKASQFIKDSTNIADDFLRVNEVYEDAKSQITSNFIHLDKSYTLDFSKSIGKSLDEVFYSKIVVPNKLALQEEPSISTLVNKYITYTTTTRSTGYASTSFYPSYNYPSYQRDSVYLGELDDESKREGFGKCTYYNGDIYEGFWSDDRPHGKGVYYWKDGGRYEGDFADGKMNGKGKRTFASGAVYVGDFEAGKKHGTGTIRFKNGDTYTGGWDFDDMSGDGVYTWHTGDKFTGKFRRDKRDGQGVLTLESGEEIFGEWVDGKMKPSV
mmetsp:Transcript_9344/g.17943  ORF Transcript_9344/g.17943 Transcript_9344/m.17943 type:complete len:384 (+) Transcript_9344:304-1455(+)